MGEEFPPKDQKNPQCEHFYCRTCPLPPSSSSSFERARTRHCVAFGRPSPLSALRKRPARNATPMFALRVATPLCSDFLCSKPASNPGQGLSYIKQVWPFKRGYFVELPSSSMYPDKLTPYTENDTKSPDFKPKVSPIEGPLKGEPR